MNSSVRTILWAEDLDDAFEHDQSILTSYLSERSISCQIIQAKNGNAVFRLMADESLRIDLIVLDIQMPEFDGLDTIDYMSNIGLSERMIIISARLLEDRYRAEVERRVKDRRILAAVHSA